jgi:hypothetical protein
MTGTFLNTNLACCSISARPSRKSLLSLAAVAEVQGRINHVLITRLVFASGACQMSNLKVLPSKDSKLRLRLQLGFD